MTINPVSVLPGNGITTGAVQVSGTAVRVSARSTVGAAQLTLIRMNSSGDWFAVTDPSGIPLKMNLKPDPSNTGIEDVSFTLPAEGAGEWYHFLLNSGDAANILAEIISLSAPAAAGGTVPQARSLSMGAGLTIDNGASADLSADRTIRLDATMLAASTSALTLVAGSSLTYAAGAGGLALGLGTGNSVLPTGNLSWTGASTKTLTLSASGAASITSAAAVMVDAGAALNLGIASATSIVVGKSGSLYGFNGVAAAAIPTPAGYTALAAAGAGAALLADSTTTGGVGATAFTLGDVVASLKTIGLLKQ